MGKSFGGVFANWSGKVGNVVGRILCGENVYSIYQPNVTNPRTAAQQAGRQKFTLLAKLGSAIGAAAAVGLRFVTCGGRWIGEFISTNGDAIDGTYPAQVVDFSKVVVSRGTLPGGVNMAANLGSNVIELSWVSNEGEGKAEADDKLVVAIYNTNKGLGVSNINAAERAAGAAEVSFPSTWAGDNAVVYAFFEGRDACSESIYLGSFTL